MPRNLQRLFLSFFFPALVFALGSCQSKKDYSAEISRIDSLSRRVDSIPATFSTLNADTLSAMAKTVESQLEYIQKNYVGYMREDIAKATGDHRILRKLLKNTASQVSEIGPQCELTKKQLADLRQALQEGATHDSQGNLMDEKYVQKALARETEEAGKLIRAKPLMEANAKKAKEKFLASKDKIQFWVDSIPELKTTDPKKP